MRSILLAFLCILSISPLAYADISKRTDVKAFIDHMVKDYGMDKKQLTAVFKQVEIKQSIIDAMNKPAEGKPWYQYRPLFVTQETIDNGVKYYQANKAALDRASKEYGVPPSIIIAIIGVETRYGKNKGSYRVIDALSTLAFEYPKRSPFFTSELEQYLLLTQEEKIDPMSIKGSYAGAMGTPQFMPSSYRLYAVDFVGDGKRNLWSNDADAIGSVANYFKAKGWKTGNAVAFPALLANEKIANKENDVTLNTTVGDLKKQGVKLNAIVSSDEKATLLVYQNDKGKEYWVGLNNFYVITRYNRSPLYALAVYQLSQELNKRIM